MNTLMLRRRAMMSKEKKDKPIMNPSFEFTRGYILDHTLPAPYLTDTSSTVDVSKLAVSDFIYVGTLGILKTFKPLSNNVNKNRSMGNVLAYPEADPSKPYNEWWSASNYPNGSESAYTLTNRRVYFRISFDPDTLADMYGYNSQTGEVYYAGINTPYYGKTNIND